MIHFSKNICFISILIALPYPTYPNKGIVPDFWCPRDEISGNNAGSVALNLVWAQWQSKVKKTPCNDNEQNYLGYCYQIAKDIDEEIKAYTSLGLAVTAMIYGTPSWARQSQCTASSPASEIFCSPNNPDAIGRFAGMLASRYNGFRGHGRIVNFVIFVQAISVAEFNTGCVRGVACDINKWLNEYADNHNAAYDYIKGEQWTSKIFISVDNNFGKELDDPVQGRLSGMSFIEGFADRAGSREWQVNLHNYPSKLSSPDFSADDYPKVTPGNPGVIVGWLRKQFPNKPHAWTIHLIFGINSGKDSSEIAQSNAICQALRNFLGTPHIQNYIYHRMEDNPGEGGLLFGLHRDDGSAKPVWSTWALANRDDISPVQPSCGYNEMPYTLLTRAVNPQQGHVATTRQLPPGFKAEISWHLFYEEQEGTKMLYECKFLNHTFLSPDPEW